MWAQLQKWFCDAAYFLPNYFGHLFTVLSSGTLLETLGIENFATASRWFDQQKSSTVEPVG